MRFSRAAFARALKALLPTGPVWPRESGSVVSQVVTALAPTYERSTQAAENLLVDAFPATAIGLLPEWEATLGLPDQCIGALATLQQRQQQVVARLATAGGQTVQYYLNIGKTLGMPGSIVEYGTFRVGLNTVGQSLNDDAWGNAWTYVPQTAIATTYFRADKSTVGEPLAAWGDNGLLCTLNRTKPAHTSIYVAYPTT